MSSKRGQVGRVRTLRWRAQLVVGVVALRPLRPRRAGGPSHYRCLADEACAPPCVARRLAAQVVPPETPVRDLAVAPNLKKYGLPCRRVSSAKSAAPGSSGRA